MRKLIHLLFFIIISSILSAQTQNNQLEFNGFIDTYHAIRIKSPNDFISSRTRLRGEINKTLGKSSMFASFNLNQNSILPEENGIQLREVFFDYTAKNWSLRAGRQLIIWGAADGVRITDLVSPMDMTESLARDYDDIRIPVEALKFKYFNNILKLELVYIPIFKSFVFPTNIKNPWTPPYPPNLQVVSLPNNTPNTTLKNGEFGGRLTFNLSGIDFSLATLHTYNKMPVLLKNKQNDTLFIQKKHHRMTFVGGDFSKPIAQFVIRGEIAFNFNKSFVTKEIPSKLHKKNTLNTLLGIDWYAPNQWMLSIQLSNENIFNYKTVLEQERNTSLLTLNISKNILNNTLKFSDFIYIDLNNSFFNRFSADYFLSDQIHVLLGYDHFYGNRGMFGIYKDNSEAWIKVKYNF